VPWQNRTVRPAPTVFAGTLTLVVAATAVAAGPGAVEIAPFAGYRFGGSVTDARSGNGASLEGAGAFGLTVDVPVRPRATLEFLFSRQNTGVTLERYPAVERFALTVDHMMVGVRAAIPARSARVHPFIAGYVGLTHFAGDAGAIAADTSFTASLGGGVLLDATRRVAVRFDARGYAVFVDGGAGLFCGGGGCSGVFGGSSMLQGEVAVALVLRL
jgi:hypothetical protein